MRKDASINEVSLPYYHLNVIRLCQTGSNNPVREVPERCPCQAETHEELCPCPTCRDRRCNRCPFISKDHFTGKAVAALLGWTRKEANASDNLQYLSIPCHRAKDKNTHRVLIQLREQRDGRHIDLGEHKNAGLEG